MATADVLVVGGGVIGSSVAYHGALAGLDVVVLDVQPPAQPHAASWASAGGVRRQGRHAAEAPLAAAAFKRWETLAAELDADLGYERGGNLRVAESDEQVTGLRSFFNDQRAHGLDDVEWLDGRQVAEIVPGISPSVVAGSYARLDGQADPIATTVAFAAAARRLGARYHIGARVEELLSVDGEVRGVRTAAQTWLAPTTVVAAGAASTDLAHTAGLTLPVRPVALQMLRTAPAHGFVLRPVLGGLRRVLSLKQLADRSFLVGGGWQADLDRTTRTATLHPTRVTGNYDAARALLPAVGDYPVVKSWYGLESESIDGLPFLGTVPGWDGLLLATGFSGHGFALAPAVGELIVSELTDGPPPADASELAARRILTVAPTEVHAFVTGDTRRPTSAG